MKMLPSLLCVLSLLFIGVCNAETKTEHYENGQKRWEFNYQDGKKHGPWTVWYENGQKESECNYVDGKKHGLETWWDENGQKRAEIHWKDDKQHGIETQKALPCGGFFGCRLVG